MPSHTRSIYVYASIGFALATGAIFLVLTAFMLVPGSPNEIKLALLLLGIVSSVGLTVVLLKVTQGWQDAAHALEDAHAKIALLSKENFAKSAFLGNISHELRTPLNAIIGYADVLVQRMFGPLGSPRYEDYAANIRQGGETLLNIVNDLFEIARASNRNDEFTCEPHDAGTVASKVAAEMNPLAAEKDIHLKTDILPRPIWAYCQREALRQVLIRLIKNSIKFTDNQGTIIVKVAPTEAGVEIWVTDNGIGIPQEDIERLGIPFQTVENHVSRTRSGLGLGLAIAKGLVERMEGKLIIESIAGRGTRVTVRLRDGEALAAAGNLGQAA